MVNNQLLGAILSYGVLASAGLTVAGYLLGYFLGLSAIEADKNRPFYPIPAFLGDWRLMLMTGRYHMKGSGSKEVKGLERIALLMFIIGVCGVFLSIALALLASALNL